MSPFEELVRTRRSIRGFVPDREVSHTELLDILHAAQWTPSNCNVQPWRNFIVRGERCKRVRGRLLKELDKGNLGKPEDPVDSFKGNYRSLQVECALTLYGSMGITREDKVGRFKALRRNFEFFDAPHIMLICLDKAFGIGVAMDVGMYVQTLMLLMHERGIGTCPQASLRQYPDILRDELAISSDLRILCGISFGYEDPSIQANSARQKRQGLDKNVIF